MQSKKLTPRDFASPQSVKWCPGCGDFAVLAQIQKTFASLGLEHEKFVIVSGIGCSSRFPYYINTYGFHSIHGRAPAVATGIKMANPELSVWVMTGDGDALSIGGNHILHAIRRNMDLKIVLFNNRIYALTKGQASPTTRLGVVTKSSPLGTVDYPVNPVHMAAGLDCGFVARVLDTDARTLNAVFSKAATYRGTVFIEVLQKCLAFTESEFNDFKDKEKKEDISLYLEHGKPLVFGKNKNKGIILKDLRPEVIEFEPGKVPPEVVIYDETNPALAYAVSGLNLPSFPVPFGIIKNVPKPSLIEILQQEADERKEPELKEILGGDAWEKE